MAASNLYYIKILGIQPDFTIDDITAYFQTARCGSGIVQEVIYLDAKKSAVLIGIEGLNDTLIDKLFKGSHKIKGKNISVRHATLPTQKQKAQAVLTTGGQSLASTWTTPHPTHAKKVPAQQEPLKHHTKPACSSGSGHLLMMDGSEQLANQGSNPSTPVQSQSVLQQTSNQFAPAPISPDVDSTPEHTCAQDSYPPFVDPSVYANMNIFEAAKLPPCFQAGQMQQHIQGSTAQQQDSQPGPQHGRPTGPQHGTPTGPQHCTPTGPQHGVPTGPQHGAPTGPQHGAPTGPQHGAPTGPQHGAPTGPQHGTPTGPQHGAPTGPQHGAPTGPQHGVSTGPQHGAPTGPQHGAPTGPQHGTPTGPQHGAPTGPQHGVPTGPQHGAPTGPQHGAPTGPQHGAPTGPQHGTPTGPQHGAPTGPQHGAPTGPQHGVSTGPQHGAPTGPQHGAPTGPQHGAPTGPQHGTPTGPQHGRPTGLQHATPTRLQHGRPTGPQHGTPTGPQDGTPTGPQHGAPTGPQHGAPTGPQHGVGQQHLGILQFDGQVAITRNSSLNPLGFSPDSIASNGQPHLTNVEQGVNENIPQDWPSFCSDHESEEMSPASTKPLRHPSSSSDKGGAVVQVEGVRGLNRDHLDLGFDDEDKGGGEIDGIELKEDVALITFKDAKVAEQVASREIWEIMGRSVKVSLYKSKPDPLEDILARHTRENTLVLRELPASVSDEHLALHLELETKMKDGVDYHLDRSGDIALMKLTGDMAQEVFQMLSSSTRALDKKAKTMLKVEFLSPVDTVLLEGIKDACCDEGFLKMYFQNKKKSGAGVKATVEVTGRGQASVTFEDFNVIHTVLSHNHSKVLGQEVSVKLYHPILSHWFNTEGTSVRRPQRAESMQHKCFTVHITAAVHHHLKRTELMTSLNAKLMDTCGKATLYEEGILVEPTDGSEWNRQWSTQCKDVVEGFISIITELSLDVPPGVMDKVFHVIIAQVHNPNVTIFPSGNGNQVVMVGSTIDVEQLEAKVKKIIYENLDTVKKETLPVPVLVLIDQCVHQRLQDKHKNVLFATDLQKQLLEVSGKDADCDQFLEDVRKLHPQVIDVRLGEEAVCLLASGSGKPLLLSKMGEQQVGYYFTNADGEMPFSDTTTVSKLHLVSENKKVAIKVAQNLQNTIAVLSVDVPEEFKHTVRSEAWCVTRRQIESRFIVHLSPQPDNRKISIVCDSMHAEQIKNDLQQFVHGECYTDSTIEVERLQWEYLELYSKDWKVLLDNMKDSGLTYSLPSATGSAVIKMKGEATPAASFTRRIHEIRDSIKVGKKEVSKPGAVKHFQSTVGKNALKGIAAGQKAVVEVYTVEEEAEEANRATSSLHHKICHGTTDDGRMVNILQGDLTEFSADVMVNAANEQLNHTGGIAGIISRKGGSIVQEESTKHVKRAGQLRVGDAVLLKPAGNLPCKAIVHAVGPRWNGGKVQEEAYLAKAVRNSLVEASRHNYTSIVFPAISSGIFGVPIHICAKAMMQGIKDFSAQGQAPQLHSITIMLFQKEHISAFTQATSAALKNFSEPMGRHLATSHSSAQRRTSSTGPRRPLGVPVVPGVELKKGSLTSYSADVYVNTAHNQLDLKHGAVAHSLLKAGGSVLQDECDRVVASRGTIPYWDIATTTGGRLQCRHVIHTVGANYKGRGCEKNLESMMTKVMQECDRLKASSVAFPALGTGNLGFPEDVVAEVMVKTITSYLQHNPSTTVKMVLLVIFMDSTHKAFQRAMSRVPSLPPASHPVEDDFELLGEEVGAGAPRPSEVFSGPSELLHSFSCNRVNVDIVNGDISADDSEGIVNTASETLQLHNFGVMGALRRKGGRQLQDECNEAVARHGKLREHKVIVTGAGRHDNDGLKCQKILHVLAPHYSSSLAKTVLEALKCADKEGLQSVALPAIGTGEHGFSSAEAAEGIADGIMQFSKSVHDNVARIKVILFQKDQFGNFAQAFEEAGKKKGFLRRLFDKVASGTRNAVQSFLDIAPTPDNTHPQPGSVQYSESTVLCIKVYAGGDSAIASVFKEVDLVIAEMIQEDCVKNDRIAKLSAKAEAELARQAACHHVRISIDRAPLNQVCFDGEKADVLLMKNTLLQELRNIENEEKREKEADLLTSKFQWQWKDDNGDFQNYKPMVNLEIEEAFSKGRQPVNIHTEVGTRTINFSQMCEMEVDPPFGSTTLRRRNFDKERKEGEHPSSWDPMPRDPHTGREVECHVVELSSHSQEYKDVAAEFNRKMTMGGVGMSLHRSLVQGQANQGRIVKIERIQNSKLYAQYVARKKAMDKANPRNVHQNERQLFHGCSFSAVDAINHGGFNRSYAGQHGTAFGRGVYFARDASYSASPRYAAPDPNGHQHMYLARVLTGEYTTGQGDFLVPPAKDPNNTAVLYDSVVNDVHAPTIFVIFYDPQAYPEYHIEFC